MGQIRQMRWHPAHEDAGSGLQSKEAEEDPSSTATAAQRCNISRVLRLLRWHEASPAEPAVGVTPGSRPVSPW